MKRWTLACALLVSVATAAALPGIPKSISGFETWKVVSSGAAMPTTGPHAGQKKVVYANAVAVPTYKGSKPLPVGSLVVKIAGSAAKPTFVALMQKTSSGWKYEEYMPRGGKYALIGSGASCSGCHSGAASSDYLFTRK